MQVCSLPAAGEDSVGVSASPGTFGVAENAAGEAMEITHAIKVAEIKETNFMGGP